VARDCSPVCLSCNGVGVVRRKKGDERAAEMLGLEATLVALKIMAQGIRDENAGNSGAGTSVYPSPTYHISLGKNGS
jgi:hypothetical protein